MRRDPLDAIDPLADERLGLGVKCVAPNEAWRPTMVKREKSMSRMVRDSRGLQHGLKGIDSVEEEDHTSMSGGASG